MLQSPLVPLHRLRVPDHPRTFQGERHTRHTRHISPAKMGVVVLFSSTGNFAGNSCRRSFSVALRRCRVRKPAASSSRCDAAGPTVSLLLAPGTAGFHRHVLGGRRLAFGVCVRAHGRFGHRPWRGAGVVEYVVPAKAIAVAQRSSTCRSAGPIAGCRFLPDRLAVPPRQTGPPDLAAEFLRRMIARFAPRPDNA